METHRIVITSQLTDDGDEVINYDLGDGTPIVTAMGMLAMAQSMIMADSEQDDD